MTKMSDRITAKLVHLADEGFRHVVMAVPSEQVAKTLTLAEELGWKSLGFYPVSAEFDGELMTWSSIGVVAQENRLK